MFALLMKLIEFFFPDYETDAKTVDWDSNGG